jgi:hypothetical protein
MQTVEVWLALPQCVIELALEGNGVVEIVAHTKRGSVTQCDILEQSLLVGVDVLISEERPNTVKLLRDLRVEGRRVVNRRAPFISMPDEEAFVQELDSMPDVYNMRVDDSLAQLKGRSVVGVADLVMIDRSANLQTREGFRTREQAYVNMIAVVLIIYSRGI